MFAKNLPVLVSPRGPRDHEVTADVHEVFHPGMVSGQAETCLAGAVGSLRVSTGFEESGQYIAGSLA